MQIFVKIYPSGKTITLDVQAEDSIATVKQKIYEKEDMPVAQQNLVYRGKPLDDAKLVSFYDINKEAKINLTRVDYQETFEESLAQGKGRNYNNSTARATQDDSLYSELQHLEKSSLANIDLTQWDPCLSGEWSLHYQDNITTILQIKEDGTFLQVAGDYKGKWRSEGQLLVLEYSSIKIDGVTIRLQCELNEKFNVFRGCKTHSAYPKGRLIYVGTKK